MKFTLHTKETAPEASKPVLDQVEKTYGFVPNLYAVFAESPVAVSTYLYISGQLKAHSALSPQEQQIVMLAVSETNGCDYCVAAHSAAAAMSQVPKETIQALREGREPSQPKQAALVRFAKAVLEHRGWVPEVQQTAFLDAGYATRHVLDLLSIVALKTLSNYTNHLAKTPLDSAFEPQRWSNGRLRKIKLTRRHREHGDSPSLCARWLRVALSSIRPLHPQLRSAFERMDG
jgi:uncharacterized peroxidase-related enzyme